MSSRPDSARTLSQLPVGGRGRIASFEGDPEIRTRMQSIGLRVGREVSVIRRSRFGGPLQVRIGTTDLLIRPQQAAQVILG